MSAKPTNPKRAPEAATPLPAPTPGWGGRILDIFSSLQLTIVGLAFALALVFFGTMAQEDLGLYETQRQFFRSWIILGAPFRGYHLPLVLPGGYLLGAVLLVNLVLAQIRTFEFRKGKFGLLLIHAGLILLLLGQVFTDALSVESGMRLEPGKTSNYSEDFHANELVLIDATDPNQDRVVALPESQLVRGASFPVAGTPFSLRVADFWPNADILDQAAAGALLSDATDGLGQGRFVKPLPIGRRMEDRNSPAASVELATPQGVVGRWLVSTLASGPQAFRVGDQAWRIALRARRHYFPYSLTLVDLRHDVYTGTDIPKNFSSRVRVQNARTGEDREVLIYMNNPLRYEGNTFYQYQMAAQGPVKASTLQVVRNPGWLTPYLSCVLVGAGLLIQFLSHLFGFLKSKAS